MEKPFADLLHRVRLLFGDGGEAAQTDGQLLERFTLQNDEQAFAALMKRHAPVVMGVSQRVLRDRHLAEDVFQATFMVLARKASTIKGQSSVAGWLSRVAYHLALRARTTATQRRETESQPRPINEGVEPMSGLVQEEIRGILDEELHGLPEKYHSPLVLCYMEGKTYEEATEQLQCPLGTVKKRLSQGREMLRERLARRGVTLGATAIVATLAETAATASISPNLMQATLKASTLFAAGKAAVVSAEVASLAEGALRTMSWAKWKLAAAVVLSLAVALTGVGILKHSAHSARMAPVDPDPEVKIDSTKGKAVEGLQLSLKADRTQTTMKPDGSNAEPVKFTLTFANVGKTNFRLKSASLQHNWSHLQVEVLGPDGEKVPVIRSDSYTDQAAFFFPVEAGKQRVHPPISFPGKLAPEEDGGVELKKPGVYRIKIKYVYLGKQGAPLDREAWTGTAVSNEVAIEVLPAK